MTSFARWNVFLNSELKASNPTSHILSLKMEPIEGSETSAYIYTRRRGIALKKIYYTQNTAKNWNQESHIQFTYV
jgi:hypothetical protein